MFDSEQQSYPTKFTRIFIIYGGWMVEVGCCISDCWLLTLNIYSLIYTYYGISGSTEMGNPWGIIGYLLSNIQSNHSKHKPLAQTHQTQTSDTRSGHTTHIHMNIIQSKHQLHQRTSQGQSLLSLIMWFSNTPIDRDLKYLFEISGSMMISLIRRLQPQSQC